MATTEPETSSGTTRAAPTLLFVDDEPEILEMYELLCRSEYNVLTADSGERALEQFGDHVDMVFVDRRMPDMSGDEIIRALRSEGYQGPAGVISAVDPDSSPAVESDTYLTKPITRDELFDTIDEQTS
jgi:CheY-like chemotaxis protein